MSRIDEALRRASRGPLGATSARTVELPLRRAEQVHFDEYVSEGLSLDDRGELVNEARSEVDIASINISGSEPATIEHPTKSRGREKGAGDLDAKLVVSPVRRVLPVEQYRRLAATLHEAQVERGLKTLMVTSAVPREGKTLTVVNLAFTLSDSYRRRVLLIDADLRHPSIHELLHIPNQRGLGEVLRSDRRELPLTQVSPLLTVLPAGRPDPNPVAGLSSPRMRTLLEESASQFDWVLLDTPPVGLLSDAQLVARLAQAVVFVIRAGSTPFSVVERAISEIGRECIIGTVLNGVAEQAIPATNYHHEAYGE